MTSARILGRSLAACAGLALVLALPAAAGMNDPHTLVVRGTVRTATGSPLAGARVIAKGDYNTEATTDDRGRYTLSVPLGSAASLRQSRYALEFRAEQGGKRLALFGGVPALGIELSLVSGSTRVRVRSNIQDATTALAAALSQDGATTAWVEANFDAATRPTGSVELSIVDEVDVVARGSARGLPVIPTPVVTTPARERAHDAPAPGAAARAPRVDSLARPRPARAESSGAAGVATDRPIAVRPQAPAATLAPVQAHRDGATAGTSASERRIGARGEPLDEAAVATARTSVAPKTAGAAATVPATVAPPASPGASSASASPPSGARVVPPAPSGAVTPSPVAAPPAAPGASPPSVAGAARTERSTAAGPDASHTTAGPDASHTAAGPNASHTAAGPNASPTTAGPNASPTTAGPAGAAPPTTPAPAAGAVSAPATPPDTDRVPAPAATSPGPSAAAPVKAATPPSESGPPPPKPITSFTSSSASILDTCACRVYGTVEIDWDRPLERNFVVGLTLLGPATQEGEVELFMGTPREFRLGPLPCGDYRLLVKPHGRVRYALRRGGSEVQIHCTGFTQVPVVLVPKR